MQTTNKKLKDINNKKGKKSNKKSLKKEFRKYKGDNLAKEFKWDDQKGKEIW